MKRMLFNATQAEELRVAIVDGQKLIDLDIESAGKEQRKSNIYKGIITRIEPSLEAAFVDYGADRHGFLPFKEVARSNFQLAEGGDISRARIQDVLREGQELIVQVDKDERGNKGAALTTFISLAGRYLVLMPNNPRGGGVSRRIEGEERNELRDIMAQLDVPQGMSIIARTAGIGRTLEELQWDLSYLMQLWRAIENASKLQSGAFLIFQEGSLVIRAIRDYFQPDIGEILIDTESIYEQAIQFMSHVMPNNVSKVKLYKDDVPLFSRFQIEHQIETAFSREVSLPSGGAIVIDHTEALVSVDVNSARSTRGSDIEQTAFNTNLEAAEETARQLRLRDLGGLIVIDFIDMESQRNQREVENRLREALHYDRARVQTSKISRFGLLELSRQRLQPSLGESSHIPCPRCHGTGHIRGAESSALHILRILQEEAMKENTAAIHAQVPVDVATFLLNEKRAEIHGIEARLKVNVVLIPNIHLETPHYTLARLRHDDALLNEGLQPSYKMVEMPAEEALAQTPPQEAKPVRQQAAVKGIPTGQPAPMREEAKPEAEPSIFGKLFGWFKKLGEEKAPEVEETAKPKARQPQRTPQRDQRREGARDGRERRPRRDQERGEQRAEQKNEPRAEQKNEPRAPQPARGEPRGTQSPRPQQQRTRQPAQQAKAEAPLAAEALTSADTTEREGQDTGETRSKRGRRGGRRERGPRQPRENQPVNNAETSIETPAEATTSIVEAAARVSKPVENAAAIAAAVEAFKPAEKVVPVAESNPTEVKSNVASTPVADIPNETIATKPEQQQAESTVAETKPEINTVAEKPAEAIVTKSLEEVVSKPSVVIQTQPKPVSGSTLQQVETASKAKPESTNENVATDVKPRRTRTAPSAPVQAPAGGLVQIETSGNSNVAATPAEGSTTPVQSEKPKRIRMAPVTAPAEPLVQIETQK
ncbi:Rne/Rng family ribonuclease [Sulfurirhabdus autotrophica]|uniref:Ribonuclease E n=1 Tax=Sulfurirhabdus autotrophica TaxID=1706046 RepID=A0A4R3YDS1_9PROT|nr:Rne/Rng family ribonuclease [Sulfurirhabdus autotrophica]TCV90051.1 RNAse E [Sulfurirhabdus autotrophica]